MNIRLTNYFYLIAVTTRLTFYNIDKLKKIYKHFGDVGYEGNKYVAFAKWSRIKLNHTETRWGYLFAERIVAMKSGSKVGTHFLLHD